MKEDLVLIEVFSFIQTEVFENMNVKQDHLVLLLTLKIY